MDDLDLVRRVTRDLWYWQGLRFVPIGIVGLVAGVTYSPAWPEAVPEGVVLLLGFVIAVVGYRAADRYYARTMGTVHPDLSMTRLRSQVKWFAVYPAMVLSLVLDAALAPSVFVSGPVWAASLVLYWWSTGRGREHYLVLASLTALFAFVPIAEPTLAGRAAFGVFFAWFGLVYVIAGILDHVALTRALPARAS
jgi:hypothetical protein